jgi:hypothetical protein
MLMICIGSFGYASFNGSIYTIASLSSPDYDIEITACRIEAYNGINCQLFWDQNGVSFNDSNVFPGWELIINTTIHNKADSWVCKLNYTIFYWDEVTVNWIIIDEAELLSLFRIEYETEFYNETTGLIIVGDPELRPCQSVHQIERLTFVASDEEYEAFLGEIFDIKIEVYGTYPDPPEGGP